MSRPHLPPRPQDCLSDLTLDRLLDGELDGRPEGVVALCHLVGCQSCQLRRAEIEAQPVLSPDRDLPATDEAPPMAQAPPPRPVPRRRLPIAIAVSFFAAAAGILLINRAGERGTSAPDSSTRLKGGELGFEVLVRRPGGRAEPVLPDVPLHPGDAIGFRVRSKPGGYLAVVSIDGAGKVSSYLPEPGAAAPRVAPGEHLLDGAVTLDAVLGRELLFAAMCPDRAAAARAPASARAALARSPSGTDLDTLDLPCQQARAVFHKVAPP